jgi:signal transduction histidine kinase/ligand-binding sensor domain-containing protein
MQITRIVSIALFGLLSRATVHCQSPISFEHYTHDDGLSAPVQEIAEDKYGFIWLGTTDGLNRFDGRSFEVYRNIANDPTSLANNIINELAVDQLGRVWAATNGGLCYYDFEDDAFHHISYPDSVEKIDRHRVHALHAADDGTIWFASKTHIHAWKDGQLRLPITLSDLEQHGIRTMHADTKRQLLWIGTNVSVLLYNLNTSEYSEVRISSPFIKERNLSGTAHPFLSIHPDTMLVGSWYGGLQKVYKTKDGLAQTALTDLSETDSRKHILKGIDAAGKDQYWIGSYGNGLSLYDHRSGTFPAHYENDPANAKSLASDYINEVYVDGSGILWVGHDLGLDKFDPFTQQFQSISLPPFEGEFSVYRTPSSILQDHRDPNILWVTVSGSGIYKFNITDKTLQLRRHDPARANSLPDNAVYGLFRDKQGRNWVGMRSGVAIADDNFENFTIPPVFKGRSAPGTNRFIQNPDGTFYFGTFSNGVFHWNETTNTLIHYAHDEANPNSLQDDRVFCMLRDHAGNLWIGTQNRGLSRLDPATGKFTFFEHIKNNPATIPDNGVYDLYLDADRFLWIATENGLAKMNTADFTITHYTTQQGLANNDVFSITADRDGILWLATNNGLSKLDPKRNHFKNYFTADGLPVNRLYGTVFYSEQGVLYIGTPGMISFCQPAMMQMNRRTPPVVITAFSVFGRPTPTMREGADVAPIQLTYKENMITFNFAALNFTNSDLNQYAYRLLGFDDTWIYCGNKQSATFTNLDGGNYTFQVKAANNDGVWNETGTSVSITVKPPYWETWWFYLLCLIAVAAVLYAAYRFRIQQFVKLQQIRMRISRDLHDDIGSTLSSINMISTMAHQRPPAVPKTNELFQTISHASNQAMELMNDIVWSINPKNDRMEMILIRMRQYASEMLEAAQITFTLDMDEACQQLVLPIEKRKDFYLIFKEAINNMAKYSRATQASIALSYHHRMLDMRIRDNGVGFDARVLHNGNGLKNMKARAMQLNGNLDIQSTPGEGTVIHLQIPVTP